MTQSIQGNMLVKETLSDGDINRKDVKEWEDDQRDGTKSKKDSERHFSMIDSALWLGVLTLRCRFKQIKSTLVTKCFILQYDKGN